MLSFFRRIANSKIGAWVVAAIGIAILGGFAVAGLSNFGTGSIGFTGMGSSTLARVGDQEVSDREVGEQMQRRLQQVREQNPQADYASIAGDFDTIVNGLINDKSLIAFADKFSFNLSKALVDSQIAEIPQAKGLNGQFSEQAYQQFLARQRLTDDQVREIVTVGMLQKLMLSPVAANARVSVGMATPYASMLLEARQGDAVAIPLDPFKAGLKPTDAELQQYYAANRNRYMIPEQRVLRFAAIGPDQVASVTASDQEITAYYSANQAAYASTETRTLSQAVVPDQKTAAAIAAKAKAGGTIVAAAAPAGANAAVTSLKDQSRQAYAGVAGDKVASAVFAAPAGTVVGPVQSDFGWVVVKVESAKKGGGKTVAQAKGEIAAKLNAEKRKSAMEDIVDKVQDAIDKGASFPDAAASAKLPVTTTPQITAAGTSRTDASYHLSPDLAPALKAGFDIAPTDQPEIVPLPGDKGSVVVSPAQVVQAAPAPLAGIRDQVAADWVNDQARQKAAAAAVSIASKASGGMTLADAVKSAGVTLPPVQPIAARRIQIATPNGQVPAPLRLLFTLAQGKSRMLPDPGGRGFYVVKVNSIVPGNALLQPGLIGRMQSELQQAVSEDYAEEFLAAAKAEMKARRNESAIAAEKARIATSGS